MGFLDLLSSGLTAGTSAMAGQEQGELAAKQRTTQNYLGMLEAMRQQQLTKAELENKTADTRMKSAHADAYGSDQYDKMIDGQGQIWLVPKRVRAGQTPTLVSPGVAGGESSDVRSSADVSSKQFDPSLTAAGRDLMGLRPQQGAAPQRPAPQQPAAPPQRRPVFNPPNQPHQTVTPGVVGGKPVVTQVGPDGKATVVTTPQGDTVGAIPRRTGVPGMQARSAVTAIRAELATVQTQINENEKVLADVVEMHQHPEHGAAASASNQVLKQRRAELMERLRIASQQVQDQSGLPAPKPKAAAAAPDSTPPQPKTGGAANDGGVAEAAGYLKQILADPTKTAAEKARAQALFGQVRAKPQR